MALTAALALLAPDAASAQQASTLELIAQRRLEYRSAVDAQQAARSSLQVIEQQWNASLRDIERARAGGNADALASARARFQDLSVPRGDRESRVAETTDRLAEARQALIEILIVRQTELIGLIDGATSNARRQALNAELDDVSNQITQLEAEADNTSDPMPIVMPNIDFSPRDTPADRLAKAEILERNAAVVDTVILDTDEQIELLEERLRNERRRQVFLAGTDRFGDRTVPTGANRGDPTVQVSDSTAAGGRPVSLEERIAALRAHREDLIEYRDQLLIKAEQFRRSVRRRS